MSDKTAALSHNDFEDRLEHLNAVLRAIRNVNQLITHETDRDRLLQGACNNLVETRGYNNAWIALRDETGKLVSMTTAGLNGNFGLLAQRLEQDWLPLCASKALEKSGVVIIQNPPSECLDCPLANAYPNSGALSIQLEYKGKIYGTMTVSIPARFIDDAEELALFAEVAGDIAFALYRIELEQARQQTEMTLRQAHDELEHRVRERTAALSQANDRLRQEIEERKRVEQELRQSEERLALAIASIRGAMWDAVLDPEITNFEDLPDETYFSPAEKRLLGYEDENLPHSQAVWDRHVLPEDLPGMRKRQRDHFEGRTEMLDHEYRVRRKDGSIRWIHGRSRIIRDKQGRPIRWIGIDWDVTERKQAEEELRWHRYQLEELVQERTTELKEINRELRQEISERKKAEVALRESQERYKLLFDQMLDGYALHEIICDDGSPVDYRYLDINPAFEAMTGLGREIIGKTVLELLPDTEPYWIETYGQVALTREPVKFENYSEGVGGKWFEVIAFSPVENQFATIFHDITERKRVEEALRRSENELVTRNRIANVFLTVTGYDLYADVLDVILDILQSKFGYFGYLNEAGDLVCPSMTRDIWESCEVADKDIVFPRQSWGGLWGRSLIEKKTLYANDSLSLPTGHVQLSSALAVPILHRAELIGQIVVADRPAGYSDEEGRLLETIAAYISPVLNARLSEEQITRQRKQAELALRRNEERLSRVIEASNTGIWEWNISEQTVYFSPRWKNLLGYEDHELPNEFEEWDNRLHPDDRVRMLKALEAYLERAEGDFSHEFRMRHKDGSYRWILNRSAAIIGDDRKPVRMYGSHLDITERKRVEEEIRRRNRELALLNRVIAATAVRVEPHAILEIACCELALAFDVPQTAAALLNEEKTEAVVVAEYLAEGRPSAMNAAIPVSDNPTFQYVLAHKTPLVMENAHSDPRLASVRAIVRQRGIVSLMVVPLVIEGEVVGTLGLDAIEPRPFSNEEINLAQNVAAQVAGSLARARLEEERRRLEEQYHQAQKMESLGRLTGGVAHDFNNLLTAINGFAELMQMRMTPDDPRHPMVKSILNSGQRAADLVRQLLAFSRKQIIEPKVLDFNMVVADMDKMLRRVIGEDIHLRAVLAPDLWSVKIDPTQLEQIIVNLAVNARDAMPDGGSLTIETANVVLDEAYTATHLEAGLGQHVMLAVSDTGVGISEKDLPQIFEPFFTTKELGRGTGLGLATVYGIIKQNGGDIQVYSEKDVGTTFKIYLPSVVETGSTITRPELEVVIPTGAETILLAEDDVNVRKLVQRVLQSLGYTLLEAENGQEALQIAANYDGLIHLLLTDVVMPDINGRMLAEGLMMTRPELKVLFMSGYTDNAIAHHGVLDPGTAFVQKPFSPTVIAHKVREVLDG
jgi:PAS domain S-box-containing protein